MTKEPRHASITPLITDTKFTIVGYVVAIGAIIGVFLKWQDFSEFFFQKNSLLNWRFFALVIFLAISTMWFVMNHFWKLEYDAHELTKMDNENLRDKLKLSENKRLTDIVTGVPNSSSLEMDINDYFSTRLNQKMQFILIDLKDFRKINRQYGFSKTNVILRLIAQTIYKRMRRNEDMYKYFNGDDKKTGGQDGFYRIYPGGDEFAFILEGDQAEAIGFANRLVYQFNSLSLKAKEIIGEEIKLSFHCALIEMDSRDTFRDIFKKAEDCYQIAKEGNGDFTICWHPINFEQSLSKDPQKANIYAKCRELFEVMTLEEIATN